MRSPLTLQTAFFPLKPNDHKCLLVIRIPPVHNWEMEQSFKISIINHPLPLPWRLSPWTLMPEGHAGCKEINTAPSQLMWRWQITPAKHTQDQLQGAGVRSKRRYQILIWHPNSNNLCFLQASFTRLWNINHSNIQYNLCLISSCAHSALIPCIKIVDLIRIYAKSSWHLSSVQGQ